MNAAQVAQKILWGRPSVFMYLLNNPGRILRGIPRGAKRNLLCS